ncbi:MAG: F0F1 ATP synthase subunit A, partial [Anaerolineae bacterium]
MGITDQIVSDVVFRVFGVGVRESVISTWALMILIVVGIVIVRRRVPVLLEMLIDFIESTASGFIPGNVEPYVPFLGSLFLFLAVANLGGIIPAIFTPTRDINTPIALALVVLASVFFFTMRAVGVLGFLKTFLTPLAPLDLIGYVSRTTSLAVRLFGNMVGAELVV